MNKRLFAVVLTFLMTISLLAGCGEKKEVKTNEAEQKLTYALSDEPDNLDPAIAAESSVASIFGNVFEGLTALDENDTAIPGIAEKWDLSTDGLTYTFHLRKDVKWSDGSPMTAEDFAYSWKRVLNPKLAADYAYMMLPYIKNAQNYYDGNAKEEDLGIKVIDKNTIEVTLESPTPYFLELCAFWTYYPVKKDVVEADENWHKDPKKFVCNGPFTISELSFGQSIVLKKNENYWNKDNVKLSEVKFEIIQDESTAMNAFETGEIDGTGNFPRSELPKLQTSDDLVVLPKLQTIYFCFNTKVKPLDNVKVRKALSYAIDRQEIINTITQGGELAATGLVPPGIKYGGSDFRQAGQNYGIKPEAQVELAKQLLSEAGYPDGKGFPKLVVKYDTDDTTKKYTEAIQQMWKKNLNIDVELKNSEWKVHIKELKALSHEIAVAGWTGDYVHPMTFLELYTSQSGNNYTNWTSKEYDELVLKAQREQDMKKSIEYMHQAEDMLMNDMPIMPLYFSTNPLLMKSYVKGWRKSPLGPLYLGNAYIEGKN